MARDEKLTKQQTEELQKLIPRLKSSVRLCNFPLSKKIFFEIQNTIPKNTNKNTLLKYKNWLFECAIEDNQIEYAISGLVGITKNINKRTRIYIESNSLLSIAYIRKGDLETSKKYSKIVIDSIKVIKSKNTRHKFYENFLKRMEEEVVLFSLKNKPPETLDADNISQIACDLVRTKNENEIFEIMGEYLPNTTMLMLKNIAEFTLKQIPAPDRLLLPAPLDDKQKREVGLKIHSAIKRVAWKSLCDPNSEIYKTWSNTLSFLHDPKFISGIVIAAFIKQGISIIMVVSAVVALVIRFGINVFCEYTEPSILMDR